jgi:hypothetical protein
MEFNFGWRAEALTHARVGIVLLMAVACSGSGTEPSAGPPVDPAGIYDLATVNGETVPLRTSTEGTTYSEIEGATLSIDSTGAYRDEFQSVIVQGHSLTIRTKVSVGNWTVASNRVTLAGHSIDDRLTQSGAATTLAAVVGDLVLVYRRR